MTETLTPYAVEDVILTIRGHKVILDRDLAMLYGVEVKFYSSRLTLGNDLQTGVKGLYAVGDGAGVTRGLVQASASGLVAARAARAAHG